MRTDLRREINRLNDRQSGASRVLAQHGQEAATAALEAVCAQLEFVRSLRELYSAELASHVASYNLVSPRTAWPMRLLTCGLACSCGRYSRHERLESMGEAAAGVSDFW